MNVDLQCAVNALDALYFASFAGEISVWVKSLPLNKSGSPISRASAYAKQSPKLSPAGCPLPLPKSR